MFCVFRCGIPVILMGETGCGKTRLIKYMCDLRASYSGIRNMILIKVRYFVIAINCISIVRCVLLFKFQENFTNRFYLIIPSLFLENLRKFVDYRYNCL